MKNLKKVFSSANYKHKAFKCVALLGCLIFVFSFTMAFSFAEIPSANNGSTTASATNDFASLDVGTLYYYTDYTRFEGFRATPSAYETDVSTQAVSEGNYGSSTNPYVINSEESWNKLADDTAVATNANSVFVLTADLDFSSKAFKPIPRFAGKFYGNGKKISNVTYSFAGAGSCGAFQVLTAGAVIADLCLDNFVYSAVGDNNGLLVGLCDGSGDTYILNCHVKGKITDSAGVRLTRTGGVVGKVGPGGHGKIYRCSSFFDVKLNAFSINGGQAIGGILGAHEYSGAMATVYDCFTIVNIDVSGADNSNADIYIGSIVSYGENQCSNTVIENCVAYGRHIGLDQFRRGISSQIFSLSQHVGTINVKNVYVSGKSVFTDGNEYTPRAISGYEGGYYPSTTIENINYNTQTPLIPFDYANEWDLFDHNNFTGSAQAKGYDGTAGKTQDDIWKAARDSTVLRDDIWTNKAFITDDNMTNTDIYTTDFDVLMSPVRNPLIIRVAYYNLTVQGGNENEELIIPGEEDGIWTQVQNGQALEDPASWNYPIKANHKFLGWTADKTGKSGYINTVKGLLGDVKLYAVWDIVDLTALVNANATDIVYGDGAITLSSTVQYSNAIIPNITYSWHKKNSTDIAGRGASYVVQNVLQSGTYVFDYVAYDESEPLWRKSGTSPEITVKVNPQKLTPYALSTVETAYIGAPYNKVTPKATMHNPSGETVNGTTIWQFNLPTPIQPDEPTVDGYREGYVWGYFFFEPDDSYNGNYGDGKDSDEKFIVYECQFPISYLQLIFSMPELNESISANIIYDGDLSYRTVANHFDTAFADYYAENATVFDRVLAGLTPTFEIGGAIDGIRTNGAEFMKINTYRSYLGYPYEDVEESITIEVFFEAENYNVRFIFNNGTTPDRVENNKKYNEQLSEPATPTNGNLLFTGWYYEVEDDLGNTNEVRWDFDNRITGDLTLTAHWLEANDLDRIEIKHNRASYTAQNPIRSGDLTVTAYFIGTLDGNTITVPVVLTWDEFKNNINYNLSVNNGAGFDNLLHVLFDTDGVTKIPFTVEVSYSFGPKTVKNTVELDIDPIKIDLTGISLADKTVMYDGTVKDIDRISTSQIWSLPDTNASHIDSIYYTYRRGSTIKEPTEIIDIGNYTVTVSFGTDHADFRADSITVNLSIRPQADSLTVSWDTKTFQYNSLVQHPTPIFTDANGNELTNINYHFEGDDSVSARGSYSITVVIDTAGFTLVGEVTTAFTITKATLNAPTIKTETSIVYTGQPINIADFLDGFDANLMEIIDGGIKTDANNNYVATISLKDMNNCAWAGSSSQTITLNWAIEKAHLTAGWDSSEYVADGNVFQPVVDRFLAGLSPVDAGVVDYINDLIYTGDMNMSAVGAYTISVSLNASADWTKNYILDGNASWAYVIVPRAGMDVITIEWDNTEFIFNGNVQKPNYTVYDRNGNDITALVAPYLTLSGDVDISKWAGSYTAQLSVAEDSNYFIRSGAVCQYTISVNPETGEGEDPNKNGNEGNEPGSNAFLDFFKKLIENNFPLWQVATSAVCILLTLIFMIKAIQYGNRKKKAKGEAKKYNAKTYATLLPIFSTELVWLNLSNKVWSIIAFSLVGVTVLMFLIAILTRRGWKKAELAKETAIENSEQRKAEAEKKERREFQERFTGQGGALVADNTSIIEEMRREMEERRREDEARHREEMSALREEQAKRDEAMKIMLANMMGRQQGESGDMTFASINDTDLLVQKVIAGLLPAVQQMVPEATAYLTAPSEQNDELIALVEEQKALVEAQNEEIRNMSSQMIDLQEQLASISSDRVEGVLLPDNSEELRAMAEAHQKEMNAVNAEMNAMRSQLNALSFMSVDEMDDTDFDDEEEWDSILDEDDDDFVESVIIEEDGTVKKTSPNFRMRLKQSSDKNREWYAVVKNMFCSQKGITYRVCKRVEKIRYQGQVIAVIGIAKKSIKLWLALKPYEYDARRYHHKDVSDKPRFVDVPMYVRVGSDRALTRAQELILALFQELNMEARKRYNDRDIQELIFTLKHNRLLTNKQNKQLLCEVMHVHDCNVLDNEIAEKCIESKNVDFIDKSVIETVKLDDIDAKFQDGNRVTLERLKKVGLVSDECTGYKVVTDKRLTKPLIIVANDFTLTAVKLIALTGGRAIKLAQVAQQ